MKITNKQLLQMKHLRREIINDTQALVGLKARVRLGAGYRRETKGEADIKESERRLEEKIERCRDLEKTLLKFVDGIEDSLTRQIFYYRYVKCMSWRSVAYMMGGVGGEDSVRKIAARYLKKAVGE